MALSNGSVLFKEFIDHNSFIYSLGILSMDSSLNTWPIRVNGYGPYTPPVELTEVPSINIQKLDFNITNDIGDSTILYLDNPFYHSEGVPIKPQVITTWNDTIVSYTVTNPNSHPVYIYTNDKPISVLSPGETSPILKETYNSFALNFTLKVSLQACGVYSESFSETVVNENPENSDDDSTKLPNDVSKVLYYKNITPEFLDSDRSSSSGFSDTTRLKELLNNWGFSEVDVSKVTEWKISGSTQYASDGPRLEWKGELFVKNEKLHLLKCRNKDNTKKQLCYDLRLNEFILLNTHASGYSGADWKWIHISELGFAMRMTYAFLKKGVDYFTPGYFMNNETENIYTQNKIKYVDAQIIDDNNIKWPWKNYCIPYYGIKGKALNGTGFVFGQKNIEQDYSMKNDVNFIKENNTTKIYFAGKPEKYNFTKDFLNNYEWLYQDFNYKYKKGTSPRQGYNFISISYQNKQLIISGLNYLYETSPIILKTVDFNAEKNVCWLFYRESTNNILKPQFNLTYKTQNPPEYLSDRYLEATLQNYGTNQYFECALNNICYKELNFSKTNQYIFGPYNIYIDYTSSSFSNLQDVTNSMGIKSEYWKDVAQSFIKSEQDKIILWNANNPGYYNEKSGHYVSFISNTLNLGIKIKNNQSLKNINYDLNDLWDCSWNHSYSSEINIFWEWAGQTNTSLTTKIKYTINWSQIMNGLISTNLPHSVIFPNYENKESTEDNENYWYDTYYQDYEFFHSPSGFNTSYYLKHYGYFSIGIQSTGSVSPYAMGILLLSRNDIESTPGGTITPGDSGTSGGSGGTPGVNPDDPIRPDPNPGITPIQ